MRIGQQIEGSGGSDMPAVAQALLLCSILGLLVLGVVLEVHKTDSDGQMELCALYLIDCALYLIDCPGRYCYF